MENHNEEEKLERNNINNNTNESIGQIKKRKNH